ncbi:MAG: TrkH family potassium uptake protein [Firmicutes bacterium]|nr:TrkH family potassium uptake protein [Bacillota bacterium]
MNLNFGSILRIVGIVLVIISVAMVPSLVVSLIYGEKHVAACFAITILLVGLSGTFIAKVTKHRLKDLKVRDGFFIVTIYWFISAFIGAVPFYISGEIPSFADAFFESCSGFSTTGASILTDIESLSCGILFWRSFTHWIGGIGILIFAIAAMPSLGISGQNIEVSETPGPMLDKITPKMTDTAKTLLVIYSILTVTETILLLAGGMNLYDSLIHTFGTVGTGGFSNYNSSVGYFDSTYIKIVITVFMVICGVNFNLFFLSMKKGISTFIHDTEFKCYMLILAIAFLLIFIFLISSRGVDDAGETATDVIFQTASILTTTGYSTCDFEQWPQVCQIIILMLMFIGGCSSSTAGGIKVIRIVVLLKLVARGFYTRLHPNVVRTPKINGRTIPGDSVSLIASHIFLYIFLVFIGTFLISFENVDMTTCFTSVITCLGNIGPGFSAVGPSENFAFMSGFSKFVLSVSMIAGRLELYTLFIFLTPQFWHPDR